MTEEEQYDKAFADMSTEPLDIDEQQRENEIKQLTAKRQDRRRNRLNAAAQLLGFSTIDRLCKAIIELSSEAQAEIKKVLKSA